MGERLTKPKRVYADPVMIPLHYVATLAKVLVEKNIVTEEELSKAFEELKPECTYTKNWWEFWK